MNCYDIVVRILEEIDGMYTVITSQTNKEWKIILQAKKNKYFLFKLNLFAENCAEIIENKYYHEHFVRQVDIGDEDIIQILENLTQKALIAKNKVFSLFAKREKKFDNFIYNGLKNLIKERLFVFNVVQSYGSRTTLEFEYNFDIIKNVNICIKLIEKFQIPT